MRRSGASVPPRLRRQKPDQSDVKTSPEKDVRTKTSRRMRKVKAGPLRNKFNPDSFCSDSEGSGVSDGVDRAVTSPVPVLVDLTGEPERLVEVGGAQNQQDVVLLSSGEEGQIRRLELVKFGRSSEDPVGKVVLPPQSLAEDTLKTIRLKNEASGRNPLSDSIGTILIERWDSQSDEASAEGSVVSGPGSPHSVLSSLRCRDCRTLFTKIRRQRPPKTRKRDYDPASLSCDEWLLIKTWHPKRRRQERGKLWTHLKRIRKLVLELSGCAMKNTVTCSRPHVFLQRNLRRCRRMTSDSKAKPRQRRRPRKKILWPPLGSRRRVKRKTFERDDSLDQLFPLDLTASNNARQDQPASRDDRSEPQEQERVLKHVVRDFTGVPDLPEGTRRELRFEDLLSALPIESQKPQQGILQRNRGRRKTNTSQTDLPANELDYSRAKNLLCGDSDEFRTPTDLSTLESKVVRKSHSSSFFSSGNSFSAEQRGSFRSMLAAVEKSHNRIIKESHS
ncbi:hypothetical protein AMEX_G19112 [Astyanax mexicanus]|uniref:Uncharacterized protein n=1 Tax=Astyanax mexicanus TaxID=7994 RepID=A0A8T2L421_ASTMX|nr:hypothetical protein AMEX_G19112 [Astyanax mexicanus]